MEELGSARRFKDEWSVSLVGSSAKCLLKQWSHSIMASSLAVQCAALIGILRHKRKTF